jgi:hypothetical protein
MELFDLAKCVIFTFTSSKKITKLSVTEKFLSEEAVKCDDSIGLRDEQKNASLYLMGRSEISISPHSRTSF